MELFGYFNEFTKKFNETEVLKELYMAGYTDDIYTVILDEMNISRVEYYFAEMLSVLEIPARDEWNIELVTSGWPDDPKKIVRGKLRLPGNLWLDGGTVTVHLDDLTDETGVAHAHHVEHIGVPHTLGNDQRAGHLQNLSFYFWSCRLP